MLANDIRMYKAEMNKLIPDFDHIHTHWLESQPTVSFSLNPRTINEFYKILHKNSEMLDYNTCVDKILQISPCYDLMNKGEKR